MSPHSRRIRKLWRSGTICSLVHSFTQHVLPACPPDARRWATFWACGVTSDPVLVCRETGALEDGALAAGVWVADRHREGSNRQRGGSQKARGTEEVVSGASCMLATDHVRLLNVKLIKVK